MINTTTTRFAEKQAQIHRKRIEIIGRYPALWANMISEWNASGPDDLAWLMYSASYLFRTGGIRSAVDPLSLKWRVPNAPRVDLCLDLFPLSFVLLSHNHKDHLDFELLSALRNLPIRWVIPEFLLPVIRAKVGLPAGQILVPQPGGQPLVIEGFRITPFDGLHQVTAPHKPPTGVPEMGYLVEQSGKRWLFPGDTRIYDAQQIPKFGPVKTLFAHLWLGRGLALMDPPPLLDAFCQFCADLQPDQVVLTHLEDLGRDADDYWDPWHVNRVLSQFGRKYPQIPIAPAYMGEQVNLNSHCFVQALIRLTNQELSYFGV